MAKQFQVKNKTKSTRCEICHQTDQFDEATETCLRCQSLVISNLVPQSNSQFQDWMVTLGSTGREFALPARELFSLVRQAGILYFRQFFLFFSIAAVILVPLGFITDELLYYQLGLGSPFYRLILSYGIPFVISSLAVGALNSAIIDTQRGQTTSLLIAYRRIFKHGFNFIFTSIVGHLYQFIGIAFCWLGVLYTYPSGAFASEVAVAEERHGMEAFKRSHRLGMRTPIFVMLLGLFDFVIPKIGSEYIVRFVTDKFHFGLGTGDLIYICLIALQVLIFPLILSIKMLTYLRLAAQESEQTQPPPTGYGSTFQLR